MSQVTEVRERRPWFPKRPKLMARRQLLCVPTFALMPRGQIRATARELPSSCNNGAWAGGVP